MNVLITILSLIAIGIFTVAIVIDDAIGAPADVVYLTSLIGIFVVSLLWLYHTYNSI